MRKMKNFEKKSFGYGTKSFGSDTDTKIGHWFQFLIPKPKPGFGCTLTVMIVEFPRERYKIR